MSEAVHQHAALAPTDPGVYLFKDARGRVLYVGKARNLRARLKQYVGGHDERPMVPFLLQAAASIDTMVVRTEKEALILESSLIKQHRPRFNVKLVDDSAFLHLQVRPGGKWPRYRTVRSTEPAPGVRHFGPFASASRARATLEFIGRRFPLRTCSDRELESRGRPCLMHQMGRCLAPCVGLCTPQEYREVVDQSMLFLEGRNRELTDRLQQQMEAAAEALRFEEAARLRDLLRAIEATIERQAVADAGQSNRDAWGLHRVGDRGVFALLPLRMGQPREALLLPFTDQGGADGELLSSVLNAVYTEGGDIPDELLLPFAPPDLAALEELISERRGRAVSLLVPQRGDKLSLVDLARTNAEASFKRQMDAADRQQAALAELAAVCRLPAPPRRIECFDNSNIQGTDPVAAMAVFIDGQPSRAHYRRYRVKTVVGADDFATMAEILGRRVRRGLAEGDLPDLLVVDGGKGQLNAALAVLTELGLNGEDGGPRLPVVGIVKPRTERRRGDREATDRVVLPGVKDPVRLPHNSGALRVLQAIRDEVHDTAVRYHRFVRDKRSLTSALERLPGIGAARRSALLQRFGSAEAVALAPEAELAAVPGIGPAVARRVKAALDAAAAPQAGLEAAEGAEGDVEELLADELEADREEAAEAPGAAPAP